MKNTVSIQISQDNGLPHEEYLFPNEDVAGEWLYKQYTDAEIAEMYEKKTLATLVIKQHEDGGIDYMSDIEF